MCTALDQPTLCFVLKHCFLENQAVLHASHADVTQLQACLQAHVTHTFQALQTDLAGVQ